MDLVIKMNNVEDANKAVSIIKEVVAKRTPEYPTEISKFIADITIEGNNVVIDESYSLMSNTFCELMPRIMWEIGKYNFGAITMDAWFTSSNCGYEADISARVFKNGKLRISFSEHE